MTGTALEVVELMMAIIGKHDADCAGRHTAWRRQR
jgi:hypothetical protein